jgi:hypothetical protein
LCDVDEAGEVFAEYHPEPAERLGDEVEELLIQRLSEDQLADLLVEHLGLGQWPEGPNAAYEVWLRQAADIRFRSSAGTSSGLFATART